MISFAFAAATHDFTFVFDCFFFSFLRLEHYSDWLCTWRINEAAWTEFLFKIHGACLGWLGKNSWELVFYYMQSFKPWGLADISCFKFRPFSPLTILSQVQVTVDGLRGGRQSRDKRRIPSCMCVDLYHRTTVLLCFTVINKEMNQIFFGSLAKFYTSSIWSQIFYFGLVYEPFAHRLTCPLTCLLGDTFLYQQVVTDWTTSYWLCLISMHTNFLWVPGLLQPFCP